MYLFLKLCFIFLFIDKQLKTFNFMDLSRWYIVHAFGNIVICYYAIQPIYYVLSDPIKHLSYPTKYSYTVYITSSIHIFHIINYKCNYDDIFHHIFFVLIGTLVNWVYNYGYITPFFHFFSCGLPGAIDYIALACYKEKYISKRKRLKIANFLNVWIRSPGIAFIWALSYIWYLKNNDIYGYILLTLLSVTNGQYYNNMVAITYGKYITND